MKSTAIPTPPPNSPLLAINPINNSKNHSNNLKKGNNKHAHAGLHAHKLMSFDS